MARIFFYEKPGCINNTRQKRILRQAGHEIVARDLLKEPWSKDRLIRFFKRYLVSEWFNMSAPAIKEGKLKPGELNADEAIAEMIKNPLLIRRPLMEVEGNCILGFDLHELNELSEIKAKSDDPDIERCAQA
jgi:nitrogenase-associated protein